MSAPGKWHYRWYMVVMRVTQPGRWLVNNTGWLIGLFAPGLKSRREPGFSYALRYLFRHDAMRLYVGAQSCHETDDWTSVLYMHYHNAFGIGSTKNSPYQDGYVKSSVKNVGNEPAYFASYNNVYRGVYDYYDMVFRRYPAYGAALRDGMPTGPIPWPPPPEWDIYASKVTYGLWRAGYFTSTPQAYGVAVKKRAAGLRVDSDWYRAVNVVTVLLVIIVVLGVRVLWRAGRWPFQGGRKLRVRRGRRTLFGRRRRQGAREQWTLKSAPRLGAGGGPGTGLVVR